MSQAFCALPPFAEAKREVIAILNSPKLSEYVPYGDVFESLTKTDDGYLIITNKREVEVIIHYAKNSHIGPKQFTIEFKN